MSKAEINIEVGSEAIKAIVKEAYQASIEQDAQKYGYKAANLRNLQHIVKEFEETDEGVKLKNLYPQLQITVPEFLPVESNIITAHLDKYAAGWREKFGSFTEIFNSQNSKGNLEQETIKALKELQETIRECFENHPLSAETIISEEPQQTLKNFLDELNKDGLLMIRSTGTHEDKADIANPGGNESLPCKVNIADISKAIGEVAASYIGEKSLSQRLIAGDTNITGFPVMPVLIQNMMGTTKESAVFSGVIYSGDGLGSRVQAAPGHGEYVVNSKGKVDNYYISPNEIVYVEVKPKEFRLSPVFDEQNKKIKLERVENPRKLQYANSLTEAQLLYLDEFAKFIEKKYEKRMDVEFVYDMDSHTINIVQARAIPDGARGSMVPSALSPEFLSKNKEKLDTVSASQVITPEVNKAAVIINKGQLIITQTIEQALTEYNKLGKNANIAGVIVEQPAPDTSHEAGVFNASAIPVMQISDIEKIRELAADCSNSKPIILDPQHAKIFQLPEGLINLEAVQDKSTKEIEEELYNSEILSKGIFASSLSSYVTTLTHNLPELEEYNKMETSTQKLGNIVAKAKSGDIDSTKELLAIAHSAMTFTDPNPTDNTGDKAKDLRQNLEALTTPQIGQNNKEAKAGLGYVLRAVADGNKKGLISKDLFKQTMISGAEIYRLLESLEQKQNSNKTEVDKAYLAYFNSQKKFEGLIYGEGDSLATSLYDNKYAKIAEDQIEEINKTLTPERAIKVEGESKSYLIQSLKLSEHFLNDNSQKQWQEFCTHTCANPEDAKKLGELVNQTIEYNVHNQWVNFIFTEEYEKAKQNPKTTLDELDRSFKETDLAAVTQARKLINTMESQVPLWSEPSKYLALHKGLTHNLNALSDHLKWDSSFDNLQKILVIEQQNRLTDTLDKSIKSLERSTLYPDQLKDEKGNNLQVARMFEMVTIFHALMMDKAKYTNFLQQRVRLGNLKAALAKKEKDFKQVGKLIKTEFIPSPTFSVNSTIINISSSRGLPESLEDIFTTVHQNMLVINSTLFEKLAPIIEPQYPNLVAQLNHELNTKVKETSGVMTPSTLIELGANLEITKAFPLDCHSCYAKIKYNSKKKETAVYFSIFGGNGCDRWNHAMLDQKINLFGLQFTEEPNFNPEKNILSFELQISDKHQVNKVINEINQSIKTSFLIEESNRVFNDYTSDLIKNRIKNLEILSASNSISKLDKMYIIPGLNFQQYRHLKEYNPHSCNLLIDNIYKIQQLIEIGISSDIIISLLNNKKEQLTFLTNNHSKITHLITAGLEPNNIIELLQDKNHLEFLISVSSKIRILSDMGLPAQEFCAICKEDKELGKLLLDNYYQIHKLSEAGLPVQELCKIWRQNQELCKYIVSNDYAIDKLFNTQDLTSEKLQNCIIDQLKDLITKKITTQEFLEEVNNNSLREELSPSTPPNLEEFSKLINDSSNKDSLLTMFDKDQLWEVWKQSPDNVMQLLEKQFSKLVFTKFYNKQELIEILKEPNDKFANILKNTNNVDELFNKYDLLPSTLRKNRDLLTQFLKNDITADQLKQKINARSLDTAHSHISHFTSIDKSQPTANTKASSNSSPPPLPTSTTRRGKWAVSVAAQRNNATNNGPTTSTIVRK